jgi:nitrate reductase beta subunit
MATDMFSADIVSATSCCPVVPMTQLSCLALPLAPTHTLVPTTLLLQALSEVLEESEQRGTITAGQHHTLMADLAAKLQPLLLHPS